MKLDIQVDASGPEELLAQMVGRLNNRSGLMGILARGLEDYEKDIFRSRGMGKWPHLDEDTIEQKGSTRVLVDSGRLLRQLTHARIVGETVVVDAGSQHHARFLKAGAGAMPPRDPAPRPPRSVVQRWADQVLGYIHTGRAR